MITEDVLAVDGAHKHYGENHALRGVSFALRKGEWLALLGPNGAGKTSLVKSIAGRVILDEGSIILLKKELKADQVNVRNQLGVVPQEIALYDNLTAEENLKLFGRFHGVNGKELTERIAWALDWVSLTERRNERVKGFSGGMKRRLNIAAAVLHRPKVILLDEPSVGVDPQSRERIWEMLEQLRKDGASLLLTTHQLDEAQQVCDRIVIIDHGRVIAQGSLDELIEATVGSRRLVTVDVVSDGDVQKVNRHVDDMAADLPGLIQELGAAGAEIRDLHIQVPNLQAVFLHLTGRELRE